MPTRRIAASGMLSILLVSGVSTTNVAAADPIPTDAESHFTTPAEGHGEGHEHAAEDLAGTPMSTIEKRTAENAARIRRATGVSPGEASTLPKIAPEPGRSGAWSAVIGTPVVPVFQAVLPNGKVLIWDSVGDNAAESYPVHDFTRAMIWNPADDTYRRVDLRGSNIFCSGFAHLADGNILVAGGNANAQLDGTVRTYVFDWRAETWTRGRDMASPRWYPSVAETADGEHVIIGGGPVTAEVRQNDGAIRELDGFTRYGARRYPFLASRPDAQLGFLGPTTTAYTISTAGSGTITATATRDAVNREYGSFATYDIGRSIVVGGGKLTEGGRADVPTRTSVIVNSGAGLLPTTTATGRLSVPRRQLNATVLADGSVLATGGLTSVATSTLVDLAHPVTAAERWDPATGAWTVLASARRIRQYHSAAVLLPDGRVLTGGGGVCDVCVRAGYLEKNVEYFSPPYLFRRDGSGRPAPRPVISDGPDQVGVGGTFTIASAQAAGVRKVALVGLGDATHGVDQGQRYVPLRFTADGTTLSVSGPPTGGVAPPGYYMLFIVDAAGVPSVARMVRVAKGPSPLLSPVRNSTGRCVDVPGATTAIRIYLQAYNCNDTGAQALTRQPDDRSVRVLGNCLDVPAGQFVAGRAVWTYRCNGSAAQRWRFDPDGTIRPVERPNLCLGVLTTANAAPVLIRACSGSPLQRWMYGTPR
ncbi:galactose oxidase-like domain-containing protein [Actinoplanes sp. NPDC049265]|uniref:galactose oxidase-like domain-containing protein n=1 Tax=Actinoplanes sp. NPDC049265 TaxID=3363902 RepID=UPI00371F4711